MKYFFIKKLYYCRSFFLLLMILIFYGCQDKKCNPFDNGHIRSVKMELTQKQQNRLLKALEEYHTRYDPKARMLKEPFSSPGYHTTLKGGDVHRTRKSLRYAVALLDTYDEEMRQRAMGIIDTVLTFQVTSPDHEYFGIWPWFAEEPVDDMAPPDRNWADFCGAQLLEIMLTHRNRLPASLVDRIDQSLHYAAEAIRQRDVGPGYTNIAIMGTFVTFLVSELYAIDTLNHYARNRMQKFYDFTLHHRGFTEYNSPTYTMVALDELSRMRKYIIDPEMKPMIDSLYNIGWEIVASHFHYPTRQWSGPHSRCYRTILDNGFYGDLYRASNGLIDFGIDEPEITEHRLPHQIPDKYIAHFTGFSGERMERDTFRLSDNPLLGTTYMTKKLSLSSANRTNFWNQRRAILGYWKGNSAINYLHVRFLHDLYDFSAANVFSAQDEDEILSAINFASNGGDTHIKLDRIEDGKFIASDIRLRFQFRNLDLRNIHLPETASQPLVFLMDSLKFSFHVPVQQIDGLSAYWIKGENGEEAWIDLVFYKGDSKEFNLEEMKSAVIGIAIKIHQTDIVKPTDVKYNIKNDKLTMSWKKKDLTVPVKSLKEDQLQTEFHSDFQEHKRYKN